MFKATRGQRIDTVFVLIIFSIFAVSVLIVLMLGASIYQNMSETLNEGADERLVLSYIGTKTRNFNDAGAIHVSDFDGDKALIIDEYIGGFLYQTVIYYSDGWLMELFSEKEIGLGRDAGVRVIQVNHLAFDSMVLGLIRVTSGNKSIIINPLPVSELLTEQGGMFG